MSYVIKSLYKEYFQKSKIFLYPLLNIKRGVSVTPIQTYMVHKGRYSVEDCKLSCLYHLRDDNEFKIFEKKMLLGNDLFDSFCQISDSKGLYVFDYEDYREDWINITNGKYSKLNSKSKSKIKDYIGNNNPEMPYIDSFLYPKKYYYIYADMMGPGITVDMLEHVGELCSKPDMSKETLEVRVDNLQFTYV